MFDKRKDVPFYDTLKYRRLKQGNCLSHVSVLISIGDSPYNVAMGELNFKNAPDPYRHCWLETGTVVVDLIHPERFFDWLDYYGRVAPGNVLRYSLGEVFAKINEHKYIEFWDFPPQSEGVEKRWNKYQRSL